MSKKHFIKMADDYFKRGKFHRAVKYKKQGLPLETTTLFDEIRKEEELAVRLDK